jgi:four helix bundle protein
MQDFRNLIVWQRAHELVLGVYRATRMFPKEELFCLTSQLRRACISIPSNIAEGCGRGGDAEFCRFLQIAMGSACEAEYQLLLARDLTYVNEQDYETVNGLTVEVKRMLASLIQKLKADN